MERNTRSHTILSQNDSASNPHHKAVHLFGDREDLRSIGTSRNGHHHRKITSPEVIGYEGGLGRIIADGHPFRLDSILFRASTP